MSSFLTQGWEQPDGVRGASRAAEQPQGNPKPGPEPAAWPSGVKSSDQTEPSCGFLQFPLKQKKLFGRKKRKGLLPAKGSDAAISHISNTALYATMWTCSLLGKAGCAPPNLPGRPSQSGRCYPQLFAGCRRETCQRFEVLLNLFPVACVSHLGYGSSSTVLHAPGPPGPPGPSCPRTAPWHKGAGGRWESKDHAPWDYPSPLIQKEILPPQSKAPWSSAEDVLGKKWGQNKVIPSCLLLAPGWCTSGTPDPSSPWHSGEWPLGYAWP